MSAHIAVVGTAGWNISSAHRAQFPANGSHLERYAHQFSAVEINSTFYRPHRPSTFERWAASVPDSFRFAVKVPRKITHDRKLIDTERPLAEFLDEISGLGSKLGPLLVQLPPSLDFREAEVRAFFAMLRRRFSGDVVCEPRHASWFDACVDAALADLRIARVAANPARPRQAAEPGGWAGLAYYRLHGSPRMYYSSYSDAFLNASAERLADHVRQSVPAWCIFDNTASGAAIGNALVTQRRLRETLGAK